MNDRVRITVAGGVVDVRLTRADNLNALDGAMFDGIIAAIAELGTMAGVPAAILAGEGRAFPHRPPRRPLRDPRDLLGPRHPPRRRPPCRSPDARL